MTRAAWVLVGAVMVVHAANAGVQVAVNESAAGPPAQSGEIEVNPYGDPIWQSRPGRIRPQHAVRRHHAKPQHAKRLRAPPHGYAAATASRPRHPKPAPIGRPLNIIPPSARAH
jgi:hypothetical protein